MKETQIWEANQLLEERRRLEVAINHLAPLDKEFIPVSYGSGKRIYILRTTFLTFLKGRIQACDLELHTLGVTKG